MRTAQHHTYNPQITAACSCHICLARFSPCIVPEDATSCEIPQCYFSTAKRSKSQEGIHNYIIFRCHMHHSATDCSSSRPEFWRSYHCSSWRRSHSLQRRTGTKLHGCKWSPAKRRLATAYANDTPRVEHTQGSRTKQPKWSNQVIWQSGLMCQFWNFKASTSWSCSCFSKALGKHWDHKWQETWARAPPL